MPVPKRTFTGADLIPGRNYRVVRAFTDYDGSLHPVGEQWRFVQKNFLPYEDGLSLFVEQDGQTVQIRLQWRDEAQGQIIGRFSEYVEET